MKDRFDKLEELEEDAELEGIMELLKQLPQSPVKVIFKASAKTIKVTVKNKDNKIG